ncbi:MAG TPA: DUF4231 domain-containing protein [Ktedonobacterales bacterium]
MATQPNSPGRDQEFLPALYGRTDDTAKGQQSFHKLLIGLEIALSLLGAAAVVASQIPQITDVINNFIRIQVWGGQPAALSIATAITLSASALALGARFIWKPGEKWRQSRYIGETDASLAWRYATKATDFDLGTGVVQFSTAEDWYSSKVEELVTQTANLDLPIGAAKSEITDQMKVLRNAVLADQYQRYRTERAASQRDWYLLRAKEYRRKRNFWRVMTFLVYAAGITLLILHATSLRDTAPLGLLSANYWPLVVAGVGGIASWVAARHYEDLLQSYSFTSVRLSLALDKMSDFDPSTGNSAQFARWVDEIESLMDAEHQQWHALA